MSTTTLIIGQSGTGKTSSLRNLNPSETLIISAINKSLPFKGWKEKYAPLTKIDGNFLVTDKSQAIINTLKHISAERPDIKTVIIDDFQYIMVNEFMRRAKEVGYQKFTDIGENAWRLISDAQNLRSDLLIFFLSHSEEMENGNTKCKTIGKMLDSMITLEGLFTLVLQTIVTDGHYGFMTKNNGRNTVKTPMDMFSTDVIENDLNLIINAIKEY